VNIANVFAFHSAISVGMYTTLDAGDKRLGLFSLKSNKKIKIIAKKNPLLL